MLSFKTRTRSVALILLPVLILASLAIACGETTTETVIQTVVVEKEVIVEREGETVVQTVVVEKEVQVEVVQTVVVEKEVVVQKEGETVVQTVVVEKEVIVEKEGETVVQTVVVEKQVEVPVVQTVIVEREAEAPSELVTGNPSRDADHRRGRRRCSRRLPRTMRAGLRQPEVPHGCLRNPALVGLQRKRGPASGNRMERRRRPNMGRLRHPSRS